MCPKSLNGELGHTQILTNLEFVCCLPCPPTDQEYGCALNSFFPQPASGENANETGIIVAGKGRDGHAYVIEDLSCRLSPDGWARRAVSGYHRHRADRIVAEVNNGGDLVERVIRTVDPSVPYRAVRASRGKAVRAEPVAALYEQGRVHHVGLFADLEDQMCAFTPDQYAGSPDRVDALVWCLTELMLVQQARYLGNF